MCNCVWGTVLDQVINVVQWVLQQIPVIGGILSSIIGWVWSWVQTVISVFFPGFFFNATSTSILLKNYDLG
jgi:phage-related protein